jgi:anti-sigma factor RsiW
MNCEIARHMMETNDPALAEHMASCQSCVIRNHARYYEAPPGLEQRIRSRLWREEAVSPWWRWVAIAACLLLAVSTTWILAPGRRLSFQYFITADVLSAHVRSLTGTHLLDVTSSDQHTVKPWFNGRVDFSPAVKDIDGFPLLGGRLEYFDVHPAAALVYGRRKHIINLFMWPSAKPSAQISETRNGYHLENWWSNGMTFWAVSDLNETELGEFVALYRRD